MRYVVKLFFCFLAGYALGMFIDAYAATPTGKTWTGDRTIQDCADGKRGVTCFETRDVVLTWDHPTEREDSTPLALNEISHYVIEVSKDGSIRTFAVAKSLSHTMKKLRSGTYQFRIATVDTDGLQGRFSEMVEVII